MNFETFSEIILTKAKLHLPLDNLKFIFGCSKMTIINETKNSEDYKRLKFVEFLEAFCRCAHQYHFDLSSSHTLVIKLEKLLDVLFETYELYRVSVNKHDNMSSSSDEDY